MALKLTLTAKDKVIYASSCIKSAALSGSYKQCSRTLKFELLKREYGGVFCPNGTQVKLENDNRVMFCGTALAFSDDSLSKTAEITAYDGGIYLKRNRTVIKVNGTPESIVRQIARDFGLKLGDIAITGINVKRNFLPSSGGANSIYNIINTVYALASRVNGKKYMIRFEADKLCIREKQVREYSLLIAPGSNLIGMTKNESAENVVTQVLVYDKNDRVIAKKEDSELKEIYNIMQSVMLRSDNDSATAEEIAADELRDNGISRFAVVNNLGDSSLMAGDTVMLEQSGERGIFWIDEDYHYWKNGIYTNKLLLNYRCMADETLSGAE